MVGLSAESRAALPTLDFPKENPSQAINSFPLKPAYLVIFHLFLLHFALLNWEHYVEQTGSSKNEISIHFKCFSHYYNKQTVF